MSEHIMLEVPCPVCRHPLDRAGSTDSDEARPKPGDYSVCVYCATALVVNADATTFLPLTVFDFACMDPETRSMLHAMMAAAREYKERFA
jgi:hypothetical protein